MLTWQVEGRFAKNYIDKQREREDGVGGKNPMIPVNIVYGYGCSLDQKYPDHNEANNDTNEYIDVNDNT